MRWGLLGHIIFVSIAVVLLAPWWPDVRESMLAGDAWLPSRRVHFYPMPMIAGILLIACIAFFFRFIGALRKSTFRAGRPWLVARAVLLAVGLVSHGLVITTIHEGRALIDARWDQTVSQIELGMDAARVRKLIGSNDALAPEFDFDERQWLVERRYHWGFGSERSVHFELTLDFDEQLSLGSLRYTRSEHEFDLDIHECRVITARPAAAETAAGTDCESVARISAT